MYKTSTPWNLRISREKPKASTSNPSSHIKDYINGM
jgi:hypothetical protein